MLGYDPRLAGRDQENLWRELSAARCAQTVYAPRLSPTTHSDGSGIRTTVFCCI